MTPQKAATKSIFVFGSNLDGWRGKGAALEAILKPSSEAGCSGCALLLIPA